MSARFYSELLSNADVRNRLDTAAKCQELIDEMESLVPHDELPKCYDWLVVRRDSL